ncbi:ABC transporter permease [Legionella fallonii]|uniref:ABC transporter permease n=1 Tax=Legionella fallonii TaxID=96230 RepID=UPI001E5A58E2|nr:ABC transporter permease [Legionella fallonii]
MLLRRHSISRHAVIRTIFNSGVKLAVPLILTSSLMGMAIIYTIISALKKYNLQHQAWIFAQDIITQNLVPLLIALFLCIQSSLTLISAREDQSQQISENVVLDHVLPIMIGMNIAGILLYIYCIAAFYFSVYFFVLYVFQHNPQHYFIHLREYLTLSNFISSVLITGFYCTFVSLSIGYYYYVVAYKNRPISKAMSQIITWGLVWLAICGASVSFIIF